MKQIFNFDTHSNYTSTNIPNYVDTVSFCKDQIDIHYEKSVYEGDEEIVQIEYLESTGTQHIDSGIYGSMDLDFYIEFQPTTLSNTYKQGVGSIFGNRAEWNSRAYQLTTYNKTSNTSTKGHFLCSNNYGWDNAKTPTANMIVNTKNIISKEGLIFTRADGTTFNLTSQSFTTPQTMFIFALSNVSKGVAELSKIRLYKLTFSRNGNILKDFIPVRVGSVGYLYDKISGQLFGNLGSGNFILGTDI